ncbi:RDD family protein [Ferruginibacter sp.]
MDTKKIYTVIALVFIVSNGYNLFWFLKNFFDFHDGLPLNFYIRYLPVFLGITGVIIFLTSGFKRSNLLRMIMCMEVISFPFMLAWYIELFTRSYGPYDVPFRPNWTFYVGCIMNISLLISSVVGLRLLSHNKVAKLNYIEYGAHRSVEFFFAPAGTRFINWLVDVIILAFVLNINKDIFKYLFKVPEEMIWQVVSIIEICYLLFYFILLEGVFNTSAGKCVTGTTIVNEKGNRPDFGQVLARSFSRLIPFEAFSFFANNGRGWHDTISKTYVTASINKEEQDAGEITFDAELNQTTV